MVASGRRKKNRIGPLILDNGEFTRNDKEVEEEVLLVFSKLCNLDTLQGINWWFYLVDG